MTTTLPPLNNLPQWSRVQTLDRARYPKPFLKDRLRKLPDPGVAMSERNKADMAESADLGVEQSTALIDEQNKRITLLEKNIAFLTKEHSEMLAALHKEIDRLKRENQGLVFRLTMAEDSRKESARRSTMSAFASVPEGILKDLKAKDSEISRLSDLLDKEKERSRKLSEELASQKVYNTLDEISSSTSSLPVQHHIPRPPSRPKQVTTPTGVLAGLAWPSGSEQVARIPPSTLADCQHVIQQLEAENTKQGQELALLRCQLTEAMNATRLAQDHFLVTKAIIPGHFAGPAGRDGCLDRPQQSRGIVLKPNAKLMSTFTESPQRDGAATFPPVRTVAFGSKFLERRKKMTHRPSNPHPHEVPSTNDCLDH